MNVIPASTSAHVFARSFSLSGATRRSSALIRAAVVVVALGFAGLPAAYAKDEKPAKEKASESLSPEQQKDMETAKKRALRLVEAGEFTQEEARASYKYILGFCYRELGLRREVRKIEDEADKKEFRKNFGRNRKQTNEALAAEAGETAVEKFAKALEVEKAEREAKEAAKKAS